MEFDKAYVYGMGPDALDALLCFGYRIVREYPSKEGSMVTGHEYSLCSAKADMRFKPSIMMLMEEISEAESYYKKRLAQEGRKMI